MYLNVIAIPHFMRTSLILRRMSSFNKDPFYSDLACNSFHLTRYSVAKLKGSEHETVLKVKWLRTLLNMVLNHPWTLVRLCVTVHISIHCKSSAWTCSFQVRNYYVLRGNYIICNRNDYYVRDFLLNIPVGNIQQIIVSFLLYVRTFNKKVYIF